MTATPSRSRAPNPSPTPLTQAARVDQLFETWAGGAKIDSDEPGCAVAIGDDGVVVYAKGFGLANIGTDEPMPPATVMDIASVSKQFTAAALLLLVQDGLVSLHDEVHRYVPELPAYPRPLRLRDLVYMESGLPDYVNAGLMQAAGYEIDERATAAAILAVVTGVRELDFAPGTAHAYSNTNYFLLRLVVERISGQSFTAFLAERIFEPLGMSATSTHDESGGPFQGAALRYIVNADFKLQSQALPWDHQGAAGVYSNVIDLLGWAENFSSGRVGGESFLRAQLETGSQPVPLRPSPGLYAAGVLLSAYRGRSLAWHSGIQPGLRSALIVDRDNHGAVALLCNSDAVGDPSFVAYNALAAWFGK